MMDSITARRSSFVWALVALLLATAGAGGSLWLSMGMHLKACPLCLYQRAFILAAVGVLFVGMLTPIRGASVLSLLTLPAAFGGLGVAGFHVFLELTGRLECPSGLFGLGTAPQQSLTVFVLLSISLAAGALQGRKALTKRLSTTAAAVCLGLLFALGTVKAAPPMPAPPTKAYEQPLEICRPPFVAENAEVGGRQKPSTQER
ncbi:MAG TPA: disulfide bond formation protein B [Pirellulaceae bacterium]|nr:disulfide bond formation protein B [Pirellulaceae bacterium]